MQNKLKIPNSYINAWQEEQLIDPAIIASIKKSLAVNLENNLYLPKIITKRYPCSESNRIVNLLSENCNDFSWEIIQEDGMIFQGEVIQDKIELPLALVLGYHQLILKNKQKVIANTLIVVAPAQCYIAPGIANGKKVWGLSVQLYTLKSEHNWGIGDFSDLAQLVSKVGSLGADFVGVNPLHALFPAVSSNISPYSPSSRKWLNIIYLDLTKVAEYKNSLLVAAKVKQGDFKEKLASLRATKLVDYPQVLAIKLEVLDLMYAHFIKVEKQQNTKRYLAYTKFITTHRPALYYQATYNALAYNLYKQGLDAWGWQCFPKNLQAITSLDLHKYQQGHRYEIEFFCYLQWLASLQLEKVQLQAKTAGMELGLYRDLAIGVSASGADAWIDNSQNLALDLSIGAPPDALSLTGQKWGLPPFNPLLLQKNAYSEWISILRSNMQACGCLRIDHILGLLRLWLIPKDNTAKDGAYVYYNLEELLAILALESMRNKCMVLGEDLGTVPVEIKGKLLANGILSYKVLLFENAKDGGFISPFDYQAQSMASVCTHDMPTIKGYWHCKDIEFMAQNKLVATDEALTKLYNERLESKQKLLDSLLWHGYIPETTLQDAHSFAMDAQISFGIQLHLAAGNSALLSLQLEDWLNMETPVNIPGTTSQYPNWQRKLSKTINEIFSQPAILEFANKLTKIRKHN